MLKLSDFTTENSFKLAFVSFWHVAIIMDAFKLKKKKKKNHDINGYIVSYWKDKAWLLKQSLGAFCFTFKEKNKQTKKNNLYSIARLPSGSLLTIYTLTSNMCVQMAFSPHIH